MYFIKCTGLIFRRSSPQVFNVLPCLSVLPNVSMSVTTFKNDNIRNDLQSQKNIPSSVFVPQRSMSQMREWSIAVLEAEKVIGYPTSFLGLRCLLSDELSYVALHLKKLAGTKHLLLKTAKKLFSSERSHLQTRGLLVLLVSKAAGLYDNSLSKLSELVSDGGVNERQRSLAEIAEMIHTADLIHRGVADLKENISDNNYLEDMQFGNKIAVLSGDYVLASASKALAQLHNASVVDIMSSAIRDITEAGFVNVQTETGENSMTGANYLKEWEQYAFLSSGSLIAKSCQCAVLLAGHPESLQQCAFRLGQHVGYILQLAEDMQYFANEEDNLSIPRISLPVLMYCASHEKTSDLSPTQLASHIKDSKVLVECEKLIKHYGELALQSLQCFHPSDARAALEKVISAMTVV